MRRFGIPVAGLLVATLLSGCLGWYPQLATTDGSSLSGISCPSASVCFAVGSNSSGNALVEQTTDAGGQWVPDTTGVTGLGLNAISCADPDHCVAVGGESLGGIISPSNAVLVTSDGGKTWEASTVPSVDGYLTSVSCPDAEHCWATSAVGIVGTSTVIVTADGGASWTDLNWSAPPLPGSQSNLMSSQLTAIDCTTTSDCLAVGEATYNTTLVPPIENQGVVSTTNDGGQSWHSQLISANVITGIFCPSADDCLAVGQDPVTAGQDSGYSAYGIVTHDGGATWTVSTLSSGAQMAEGNNPAINAISCSDVSHCVAVGEVFDTNKYEMPVLATTDGGATWSDQATNPTGADLESVACVTSSTCWAVGFTSSGSVIVHTLDGGAASPTVTGVSPNQGPGFGGAKVSVSGAGFKFGVTSVQFGSVAATDVTVVSDSELTVTVPPSTGVVPSAGTVVDVTVTTALGTSPLDPGDQFTYLSSNSSTPGITLTTTAPGAFCNNANPGSPVCSGLASGDVLDVGGTVFSPGAIASIAECNGDPSQPVIFILNQYIPVSCSRLVLTNVPIAGQDKGDLSAAQPIGSGTLGPPAIGITPACTEGTGTIPGCTTSGNAEVDAAGYPCPPTPAQQAKGDSCVIAVRDTAGDVADGIILFGQEPSPGT